MISGLRIRLEQQGLSTIHLYLFGIYTLEESKLYCILVSIFIIFTSKVKCCDQSMKLFSREDILLSVWSNHLFM